MNTNITQDGEFLIESANLGDADFLGKCICYAERAHTGTGLWDVLYPENVLPVLTYACVNDSNSHFHISKCLVARHIATGQPVAAASGFCYPECSVEKTKPGICQALLALRKTTSIEEGMELCERLNFLDESFPADVDYDHSWMIDSVYTEPDYRGRGLSLALIQQLVQKGAAEGRRKQLISCANGNDPAKSLYIKAGFHEIGHAESSLCQSLLGTSGFTILLKEV